VKRRAEPTKHSRKFGRSENWQPVALYDNENYFRGPAVFETEKEARKYMEIYESKLQARNDSNTSNNQNNKIRIDLNFCRR
jgi:hypothetical protein